MSLPEEYQNVLVYRKDGTPVIAHRNGSRWYGYTLLKWLDFEPDVWTHLEQIDALRAELAHKDEVIVAQKEVIEALDKTLTVCWSEGWLGVKKVVIARREERAARAKLEELEKA